MRTSPPSDLALKGVALDILAPLREAIPRFVEIGVGMASLHTQQKHQTDAKETAAEAAARRARNQALVAKERAKPKATAQDLDTAIGRVTIQFQFGAAKAADKIKTATGQSAKKNKAKIDKQLKRTSGIEPTAREPWLTPAIDAFANANAKKIKSIGEDHLAGVAQLVTNAALKGDSATKLAKKLQQQFGVTSDKAKFLARDQIAKFNAALTQTRAQAAGVSKYIWRTSQDERVRPSHAKLEGKTFSFARPPLIAGTKRRCNPGEDYNCRCTAELVVGKTIAQKVRGRRKS